VRRLTGYEPFCCLTFGSAAEHQSPSAGGGAGIYFHPTSALYPHELTDPLHRVDWSTLFIYFIGSTYLPTSELVSMNPKPLPYPPQMRNGGLPPAHLPYSPHSDPVAAIANLKAIVSDAIAALAKNALTRHHEAAAQEKALADEANERRRHEAACTRQEAAANHARVSDARSRPLGGRPPPTAP
jgi:hypothetical protein